MVGTETGRERRVGADRNAWKENGSATGDRPSYDVRAGGRLSVRRRRSTA